VCERRQRDDQLGRVAEARVEEATDARAQVGGRVLGGFPDRPGKRNQRDRSDDERPGSAGYFVTFWVT
jgi:hypothetical protein